MAGRLQYTDCVVVCPADCFYEGEKMLFIHPDECLDCDACRPECPVEAIFHEGDVPEKWRDFIELNREMAEVCPPITERKEPLAGRDKGRCRYSLKPTPVRLRRVSRGAAAATPGSDVRPPRGRAECAWPGSRGAAAATPGCAV